jgi:tRNA-dihydrouridine synthase B
VLLEHLHSLHELYGPEQGLRVARKHIGWTVARLPGGEAFRRMANAIADAESQVRAVRRYFDRMASDDDRSERMAERMAA